MNSSSFENEAIPATLAGSRRLRINVYNATDTRVSASCWFKKENTRFLKLLRLDFL